MWSVHYAFWITNTVVELLNLEVASVATLELRKWEGAKTTDICVSRELPSIITMRKANLAHGHVRDGVLR